jgi:GNAT superfamily N-acetyltransferase
VERRTSLELANDNAAAHWLAMAGANGWETRTGPGYAAVRCEGDPGDAHRVVVTRPPADAAGLTRELIALFRDWETGRLCLEDPYRVLDLSGHGCGPAPALPVMVRPAVAGAPGTAVAPGTAGAPAAVPDDGSCGSSGSGGSGGGAVEAGEALGEAEWAESERVVVDGFPLPDRMPLRRGRMFPAALGSLPGRRSWLARRGGLPAGACVTWDDGASVGLYWVAVLPEHRSHGVARTLLEAALRAHPGRPATLTATSLGRPLYRKLGFVEEGLSTWWRYPVTVVSSLGER